MKTSSLFVYDKCDSYWSAVSKERKNLVL